MNEKLTKRLESAVFEFGLSQNICSPEEIQKHWERCTAEGKREISDISPLKVVSFLTGLGTILKEDSKGKSYVTTVNVGLSEALLVTLIDGNELLFAACAHEGMIYQNIASKAIACLEERIDRATN